MTLPSVFAVGSTWIEPVIQMKYSVRNFRTKANGFALIVAMLFMVALSFIGVASIRNVSLQERMAGNSYYRTIATHESEALLRISRQLAKVSWVQDTFPAEDNSSATLSPWGGVIPQSSISFFSTASNWLSASVPSSLSSTRPVSVNSSNEAFSGDNPRGGVSNEGKATYVRASARATDPVTGASVVTQDWSMFPK